MLSTQDLEEIKNSSTSPKTIDINRLMSEELLLNDRLGNLIQGLYPRSIFLYGCITVEHTEIRTMDIADPLPEALLTRLSVPACCYAAIVLSLATSFTTE